MKERRILPAEDHPDDRLFPLQALREVLFRLLVATIESGTKSLDCLLPADTGKVESRANPDLMLLELKLPRVDGLQVRGTLRRKPGRALIPVVILATSKEPGDVLESYHSGSRSLPR